MLILFLTFLNHHIAFHDIFFYCSLSPIVYKGFNALNPHKCSVFLCILIVNILASMMSLQWYSIMIFICISQMISDVVMFSLYAVGHLYAISGKCLFSTLYILIRLIVVFFFLYKKGSSFLYSEYEPLIMCICVNIFSYYIDFLFILFFSTFI